MHKFHYKVLRYQFTLTFLHFFLLLDLVRAVVLGWIATRSTVSGALYEEIVS